MTVTPIPGTDVSSYIGSDGRVQETDGPAIGGSAGTPSYTRAVSPVPVASDQQITIATLQTVQQLTVPATATVARLQNNTTAAIRWRDAGTNPTTTVGQRILAGEDLVYDGSLAALRLIAEGTGTGTLDIAYYR